MNSRRLLSLALSVLTGAAALVAPAGAVGAAHADVQSCAVSHAAPIRTGCATGPDTDGDGQPDATDGCPTLASDNVTGCPTVSRRARLRYLEGKKRLQATITSTATACSARSRIKLWRVAPRRDVRVEVATSSFAGRHRFTVRRGARYYVTVSSSYAPGTAECASATSRTVRVPKRR